MLITILIAIVALIAGAAGCYFFFRYSTNGMLKRATIEAENIKKNKIIEAKEKFIALKQ